MFTFHVSLVSEYSSVILTRGVRADFLVNETLRRQNFLEVLLKVPKYFPLEWEK